MSEVEDKKVTKKKPKKVHVETPSGCVVEMEEHEVPKGWKIVVV